MKSQRKRKYPVSELEGSNLVHKQGVPGHTWASNGFFGGASGGNTVNKGLYVIK